MRLLIMRLSIGEWYILAIFEDGGFLPAIYRHLSGSQDLPWRAHERRGFIDSQEDDALPQRGAHVGCVPARSEIGMMGDDGD